jgi:peptidoglycan/xylan/chitin deacetylase (PgdA/CDA1 family)
MKRIGHALIRFLGQPLATVIERSLRFSARGVGVVVVYHRVGDPPGDPRVELVPALATHLFEAQARHLGRHFHVVPPSRLLGAIKERRRGERFPAAITFDDDLRSHAEIALPILRRLELPAVFFLSGTSLEEPFEYWWQSLQAVFDRGLELPADLGATSGSVESPATIHGVGRRIEAMTPEARDRVTSELEAIVGPPAPDGGLRTSDVRALVAAGYEIGFHTVRHDPLPSLDDEALARALRDGRDRLEEAIGSAVTTIAYPHGKADARVGDAARAAGYQFGFTGAAEPVRPDSDPLLLGRINHSYRSVGHFALQLLRALLRGTGAERREPFGR